MANKPVIRSADDDIDALIDQAVDTFFVEAPTVDEVGGPITTGSESLQPETPRKGKQPADGPSLDDVMDSLFMGSFSDEGSQVTSGDDETDRAIDLAVDTLFVEAPDAPPPETAQLEVKIAEAPAQELDFDIPRTKPKPSARIQPEQPRPAPEPRRRQDIAPKPKTGGGQARKQAPPQAPATDFTYDDAMALEIERHMATTYREAEAPAAGKSNRRRQASAPSPVQRPTPMPPKAGSPLRKLQEAIFTLEWEISRRSVHILAEELQHIRAHYKHNVTVDFAALSMRVVLEYIVKRMSRAHPESVRFLLEIADFLDRNLDASEKDPLNAFHFILSRYEQYKVTVRQAEGLPAGTPPGLDEFWIEDPEAFAGIVESQAKTLIRAGHALAKRLNKTNDPQSLIRSFRFLVNRSVNRVLECTHSSDAKKKLKGRHKAR